MKCHRCFYRRPCGSDGDGTCSIREFYETVVKQPCEVLFVNLNRLWARI